MRGKARIVAAALLLAALAARTAPAAAQTAGQVRDAVDGAVALRQETQQRQDDWAREKDDLQLRYREAKAAVGWLEGRTAAELQRVEALEGRVAELRRRLAEADRLEGSMQDTLQVIYDRLAESVDRSLPFLPEERRFRLDTLQDDLVRPDIPSAEKLRRLLEALQVEASYGGSVEVYQDEITVGGEPVHADVLRLGRVALFWMTPDRRQAGVYDEGAAAWVETSAGDRRRIELAMEMASRLRPIELIDLPLGRIAGSGARP